MAFTHSLSLVTRRAMLAGLSAMALAAQAQDYRGPIKLLVGYPPGGPADTAARIVADKLGPLLGQTVVVDNRPGAGGQIAALALKAAPADGSVLFLSNVHTVAMIPLTVKTPGYLPARDFRAVGTVATFELALASHPMAQATTLAQLGAWLAARPAQASIGVPAPASAPEFLALKVAQAFKVDSVPVAYKGAGPLVQDLLGGQISAGVSGVTEFLQHHQAGRLRIVAVTRATPLLPGVPSFADAGLAGLELTDFLGVYAPAAMSTAMVERYNKALNQVLAMPETMEKLRSQAMTAAPGTTLEQTGRLNRVSAELTELVRISGYRPQ